MIKKLTKITLGLVLLLVAAVAVLLSLVNTEQNKTAIQTAVLTATGYELTIAGDMNIRFFPSIGLTLNDVRLKNPAATQELASTTAALLEVDLRALIRGELYIRELSTDDFHINYFIGAEGNSNWDIEQANASTTVSTSPSSAQSSGESDIVTVSFERLQIENASIDIQDLSQGVRYSINNMNLTSTNANLDGLPFDIDLSLNFLNNGMSKPMPMALQGSVRADVNAGELDLENLAFSLTPLLLQGELHVRDLQSTPKYEGSFSSNEFDLIGLMQTAGLSETDPDATDSILSVSQRPLASVDVEFVGDEFGVEVSKFLTHMADTELEADATISFATNLLPANISYEVVSNRIDVSPFLTNDPESLTTSIVADSADVEEPVGSTTTAMHATGFDIPSELLSSFNVLGSIAIESVVANDYLFESISLFTNVEDGVLDIELQPVSTFEGSIAGTVRLDGRTEVPSLSSQLNMNQLNLIDLAPSVSRLNSVTGKLDVEMDLTAQGGTSTAMMESLQGSTTFDISENSVDIGVLKQVFTAISALSPTGGTIEQWPDVIRFAELGGFILFNEGISENQQINLRMDNFDISGTGGLDLAQENFSYDLEFTVLGEPYLQTIPVNELYHDVSWPVECAANFADEVSQYCRPDFTQVREIFTQLGTNAVRSRLNEAITDQLPDEVRDGARGLLRNLLN